MKIQAYYQNWQIFWGAYTNPTFTPLTPSSWAPIAKGLDKISYGFANLGEHAFCNDPPKCSKTGWATDNPQNYKAHEMYPSSAFPWMGKSGTADDATVFTQLVDLQNQNKNIQLFLAFGGWTFTEGTTEKFFTEMMSTSATRQSFMESAVTLAKANGFNGIEIDWEYPGSPGRGGTPIDFYNMEQFVVEFKANPNYAGMLLAFDCGPFLSSDVIALKLDSLPGYPAGTTVSMTSDADYFTWLARLGTAGLDDLQIMAYDFYTASPTGGVTMPNAPLDAPTTLLLGESGCSCGSDAYNTTYTSIPSKKNVKATPYSLVKVHGAGQTPVSNLLETYNNVLADGTPDYASFSKNNNISPPADSSTMLDPTKTYLVCGLQYTVASGDYWYKLCATSPEAWENGPGTSKLGLCGTSPGIASYVAIYNGLVYTNPLEAGVSLALPISTVDAKAAVAAGKATTSLCTGGPPPPPPVSDHCIKNTVTGIVAAYKAAKLDPSASVWVGLAQYGRSYAGVDFSAGTDEATAVKSGKTYITAAPGGSFSGACGEASCGTLSYREISSLLKSDDPTTCNPGNVNGPCGPTYQWKKIPGNGVDPATSTAVAYDTVNKVWISYDNVDSIALKLAWLTKQPLAGVMLFGPGSDDADFTLTNSVIKSLKPGLSK